jgi:hypothetical protein
MNNNQQSLVTVPGSPSNNNLVNYEKIKEENRLLKDTLKNKEESMTAFKTQMKKDML